MVIAIFVMRSLTSVYRSVLMTLFLASIIMTPMYARDVITNINATIDEHGLVHISIILSLSEGFHRLPLSIEPLIPTINVVYNGETLPVIYDEGHLYLVINKDANIVVSYVANVSIVNNIFYLDLKTDDIVKIEINENIILLSWPEENIIDVDLGQGALVLYIKGPATIRYTLKQQNITYTPTPQRTTQIPTNTETPLPTPTQTSPHTTQQQITQATQGTSTAISTVEQEVERLPLNMVIILIVIIIGVGGATYYLFLIKKRRHLGSVLDMLSDLDIAIIKVLDARGGSALQSELQSDIKVPKTTLWRHIKKLEKLGIVRVEKIGLQNKVVLIKKIRFS